MFDLFDKRMSRITPTGGIGTRMVQKMDVVADKLFYNDQNFRRGMLYDWSMNEIEEVDFKIEKIKTYHAEGNEIEYMIQFRPNFNIEHLFKDLFAREDKRERYGFYIDVYDFGKEKYEKWLIVGKDDRVAFDRYNVLKCNWYFEWIYKGEYHKCLGCVREATDNSFRTSTKTDKLGGTTVQGEYSIIYPFNENTMTILLGQKFIISDNVLNPQVFEVTKIKDTIPFGVVRCFLKEQVFNPHTDIFGIVNDMPSSQFVFDLPIEDLPEEYGGKYHMLCDALKHKNREPQDQTNICELECSESVIYVGRNPVKIKASFIEDGQDYYTWRYQVDGANFGIDELKEYFEIKEEQDTVTIKAINDAMVNYQVSVYMKDVNGINSNTIELEVKL